MNGMTASRPNAHGEFNESIIMSNRPLRDAEIFEVRGLVVAGCFYALARFIF